MASKQSKTPTANHTAGIFADMTVDGPEIGTLVAVVDRARNLPNRKTMGKQDPYCALRLGKEAKKTDTDRRGGQTPKWDQEIRFTVHESPDYNKLKCSIFNDDKRTDLISEGWIDLKDVIIPGGGQNDIWHQLNYKGKYAGDIRIELTYYDTRSNPNDTIEKKRSKTASSVISDTASTTSGPRQLGPREIRRRPLPTDPVVQPLPESTPVEAPPPLRLKHQRQHPTPPPLPPLSQPSEPHYHQQAPSLPPPPQQYSPHQLHLASNQQYYAHSQSSEEFDHQRQHSTSSEPFDSMDSYERNSGYDEYHEPEHSYETTPFEQDRELYYASAPAPAVPSPQSYSTPPREPSWDTRSSPYSARNVLPHIPQPQYNSSPPSRSSPPSSLIIGSQSQPRPERNTVSPTKHIVYKDSPLRQSVSHNDLPLPPLPQQVRQYSFNELPPPPPNHRASISRSEFANSYPDTPRDSHSSTSPSKYSSIEDRSPLQTIEYHYGSQQVPSSEQPSPGNYFDQHSDRRYHRDSSSRLYSDSPVCERPPNERRNSAIGEFPAPHQLSPNYGIDFFEEPVEQDPSGRYIRRLSSNDNREVAYRPPQRAHTFDNADVFDGRNIYRSEPQIVRPRAISPNAGHSLPRKSVSPHPQSVEDRHRMGNVPFGPDSYDTLNPTPNSMRSSRGTSQHAGESSTREDCQPPNDQAPIIGNDGSIIDPSDHLPSETWAPEPEKKSRKPEHVIRFRTKETRAQPTQNSSPVSTKILSATNSPHMTTPNKAPLPTSPHYSTPNLPSTPTSGSGRNRLQKQMPTRPLPVQPFQHANSSPASIPQISRPEISNPNSYRSSMYSSSTSNLPQRPPLSEYQIPAGNRYSPRESQYPQQYPPTPTKLPQQRPQSIAYGGHMDPLVAEMSMIDIGPPRSGGRTMVRQNRGFNGY